MSGAGASARLLTLDLARTAALAGMVVFHFTLDLELFGHIPRGTIGGGGWPILARIVAASFLFLAGVSMYLAHGGGIRWAAYLRRLLILALAAGGVTLATVIALPDAFIFFGILHSIAVASVIGLGFLALPWGVTLLAAAGVLMVSQLVSHPFFDAPALLWLGLGTVLPVSMDFEPVFPWAAPFLAGLGVAKALTARGAIARLAKTERALPRALHRLAWPGRHSLAIYLCHQPLLFGVLIALARLSG